MAYKVKNNEKEKNLKPAVDTFPDSFYKKVVAAGPAMLILEASSLAIVLCNEQFENDTGYLASDISAGKISLNDIVENNEQNRLRLQLTELSRHEKSWGEFGVYTLTMSNGKGSSFLIYFTPVSITKKSGADYFRLVLLNEPDGWNFPFISSDSRRLFFEQAGKIGFGTFEWYLDTNKILWSDSIYKIYEIDDHDELIDYDFVKRQTHPDDSAATSDALERAIKDGQDINIEYRIITVKQNIKFISVQSSIVRDENNNPYKLVGCVRDITEKRLTEQNLKKNVSELNRSNHELEEFAYVASHDLQEPLRKIMTFCDRLSEKYKDNLSGDGAMYIERIVASANNMRLLINNLLEFSRVARLDKPFSHTNLNLALKEVKADLEILIEETNTVINSSPLPVLEGSLTQMKQLFMNILSNAIKFRKPQQKPVINIKSSELTKTEKLNHNLDIKTTYYKIEIKDNGIGFDEEYSERIFQVFQRLHGKSEYPGSGIGLATCKKIVEHHNGLIYAKGEPGIGATFVCILPETQ